MNVSPPGVELGGLVWTGKGKEELHKVPGLRFWDIEGGIGMRCISRSRCISDEALYLLICYTTLNFVMKSKPSLSIPAPHSSYMHIQLFS